MLIGEIFFIEASLSIRCPDYIVRYADQRGVLMTHSSIFWLLVGLGRAEDEGVTGLWWGRGGREGGAAKLEEKKASFGVGGREVVNEEERWGRGEEVREERG